MEITCPHCSFSRSVDPARVPDRPVKVTCPRCKESFSFDKAALTEPAPPQEPAGAAPAGESETPQVTCPACGLTQPAGETCSGCGIIYAKWEASQQAKREEGAKPGPETQMTGAGDHLAEIRHEAPILTAAVQPKAGFWIRFVAYSVDGAIVGLVQFILGWLLVFATGMTGSMTGDGQLAMSVVSGLLGITISFAYGIFFIGYCGQTPGKMLVRIKVIRTDGSAVTYGHAFLREVVGKFISGILLGIGYLMVAFDSQKQGLHDKIADTYVVKL